MKKLLVVDDEESICEILQFNLEIEGFEVDVAYSAEEAMKLDLSKYSLILLDVMMGEMNGFKFALHLKKDPETANIPIIFCTAKDTIDNKLAGFTIGADDYISKPFAVREVVARVKSVLKRCSGKSEPACDGKETDDGNRLIYDELILDKNKYTCTINNEEIPLTKKEMEILQLFLEHPGKVFSREEILESVWSDDVIVTDRTIDVNITRLRKKIGDYGKRIITRQCRVYGFDI